MAEGSNGTVKSQKTLKSNTGLLGASAIAVDNIKAFFFDLDNTLIPTRSGDLKAIRKLGDVLENQFSFSKEESATVTQCFLKSFRRCPDNSQTSLESWRTYLWREALPAKHKHLAEQIYPKWLKLRYRYLALQAEYVQMLQRLRAAGYYLALITNGPSNAQWEKINKLHVSQYFDCVLVSSDLPWEKPNPNIFYAACNFLRVKPPACVMIGDKLESDIKGGRLAGLGATIWLPLSTANTDLSNVTHTPDLILRQLLDIYKHFPVSQNLHAVSNSNVAAAAATTMTHSQSAHRISHHSISFSDSSSASSTGRTWNCDRAFSFQHNVQQHQLQLFQQQHHHEHEQQQQDEQEQDKLSHIGCNKYRRGGSLPTMDYFNSETENSSDSMFS